MSINRGILYKERKDFYSCKSDKFKLVLRHVAYSRLLFFLSIIITFIVLFKYSFLLWIPSIIILLIVFIYLIKKYSKIEKDIEYFKRMTKINADEKDATDYNFNSFYPGNEYININHSYSYDLDIFGDGSIYQFLNRTVSLYGKNLLADWLQNPLMNRENILNRQDAIKELSEKLEFRQNFLAAGMGVLETENEIKSLNEWLNEPSAYFNKKRYKILIFIAPLVSAILILLSFFSQLFFYILIVCFFSFLILTLLNLVKSNKIHERLGKQLNFLRKIVVLTGIVIDNEFISGILKDLKKNLFYQGVNASNIVKIFSRLVAGFDNRLNLIAAFFLNGFLLWDIRCIYKLEKWKGTYKSEIKKWVEVVGIFDAYISLANYCFNNSEYCFPTPSESIPINAVYTGHPLVKKNIRVDNDFNLIEKGQFAIVTGANMAGKSTFLRTIGVNLILAQIGAPVCAKQFSFRPVKVFTSMRTSDSLQKNESYFYAELKRLKFLLDTLKDESKSFIILDEILKGTNSKDKQLGSQKVLEKILKLNGTGLIATHDLELAKLQKIYPQKIVNKCFEIEINGKEIHFDYKLREGVTKKMNALLLIQSMGLV